MSDNLKARVAQLRKWLHEIDRIGLHVDDALDILDAIEEEWNESQVARATNLDIAFERTKEVDRLREENAALRDKRYDPQYMIDLRDERDRLREALIAIANDTDMFGKHPDSVVHEFARQALEGNK